jgi:UDP-glucose 4-epimerase
LKILIAGGAGYIGSTVASALLDGGHDIVVIDNLSTGSAAFLEGRAFYTADIADPGALRTIFTDHPDIDLAIHCAALIAVEDSMTDPLRYYDENVAKSIQFVRQLVTRGCRRLIFSSSASIYSPSATFLVDESSPLTPASPYGRTKAILEAVLRDSADAYGMSAICLRYFNPVGADPAMRTGSHQAHPSHVLGRLAHAGEHGTPFQLFGNDWPTRDGTAIRDFIHVWDLATAHRLAAERFDAIATSGTCVSLNVGTGHGTTIGELVSAYESVTGHRIVTALQPRRPGDVAGVYTGIAQMREALGWQPEFTVHEAIGHATEWDRRRRLSHSSGEKP